MKHSHFVDKLAKFLIYLLGRHPDEFGLVPDGGGYVRIKDVMKALGEEPGWRQVRLNHLNEVMHHTASPCIEIKGNFIRAVDRSHLFSPQIPDTLPKLLYYPIRRRAYPVVLEKGLTPHTSEDRIVLAIDQAFAQRLGRRIDPAPVILTVNSSHALLHGATVWQSGEKLFLCDRLPPGSFSGPPLPKQRADAKQADKAQKNAKPKTPGSYLLDLADGALPGDRPKKATHKRKNEWKRERKRRSRKNPFG